MATQLFLTSTVADTHLATDTLRGGGQGAGIASSWTSRALSISRGGGVVASFATPTLTNATDPYQPIMASSGIYLEWISPPVSADVTISGTITANIWAAESNMSANVQLGLFVDIIRANATATRNSNTLVATGALGLSTEIDVTTRAVRNFTAAGDGITVNRGDRLRVFVGNNGLSSAATFTWNIGYNGSGAAADGDTYVTFTENFSFESAPAGSVLYLTNTASAVGTAVTNYEAWTSRGNAAVFENVSSPAGWTAPVQIGGPTDWYTRQLTAFTLTGKAVGNLRLFSGNTANDASARLQIARVDSDGTNATVWADWCIAPTGTNDGEVSTTETAWTANVSGDDLAFTNGQRIRIRVYVDDKSSAPAASTGSTIRLYVDGPTPAASGDTYLTLPVSVSEFVTATAGSALQTYRQRRAHRFLTTR